MATTDENREVLQSRAARNHALHRELNDAAAAGQDSSSSFREYVCECSVKNCAARIALTGEEYAEARNVPNSFIVAPGHWSQRDELVVAETERYVLIEKTGDAARLANALRRTSDVVH
jgi:hypothetical protein